MIATIAILAVATPQTLQYGGIDRRFSVYRPTGLSSQRPVPLVVVLHGGFGTGEQAEQSYGWDAAATRDHFVVVYPDGVNRSWHAGPSCCGRSLSHDVDDVGFLSTLIKIVSKAENVDPKRVMIAGMSNGAMMAYRMACESPVALHAIGSVSGTMLVGCAHPHHTSVMEIHGAADKNVPYNGGRGQGPGHITTDPIPSVVARWRAIDECASAQTARSGIVITIRARCKGQDRVELIALDGAGHQWPGSKPPSGAWVAIATRLGIPGLDQPSTALDATRTLCEFFGLTP